MRSRTCLLGLLLAMLYLMGCGEDAAEAIVAEDSGPRPSEDASAEDASAEDASAEDASADGSADGSGCDLSGVWVTQHVTSNVAVGATQLAANWNYHRFEQDGIRVRIVESLDCGYAVRGTTDVSLSDAALEAIAVRSTNAVGVEGTFQPTEDGEGCELAMDRIYTIRGANKAEFLDAVWQIGDEPVELSEFDMPANEAEGMEDWDDDGHEGLTQLTGVGDRYTAQIDWHAFRGTVPLFGGELSDLLGGKDELASDYDMIESVSEETTEFLRTSSVPMSPGIGFMIRADDLEIVTSGEHPELDTCKNVQAMAVAELGPPAQP